MTYFQIRVALIRSIARCISPRGTFDLVAYEKHILPFITQHGFEVVYDPAGIAHTAPGDHDGRAGTASKVVHYFQVFAMAFHRWQIVEG